MTNLKKESKNTVLKIAKFCSESVEFQLNENSKTTEVEIFKTGRLAKYNITFEKKHLEKILENYSKDKKELPVNYDHDKFNIASGWIKSLALKDKDGDSFLIATIEFTKLGAQRIKEKEYRYISIEMQGTLENFNLTGAGLTNLPAVEGLKSISLSEEEKEFVILFNNFNKRGEMEDLKKKVLNLSEEEKKELKETLGVKEEKKENGEKEDGKKEEKKENGEKEDKDKKVESTNDNEEKVQLTKRISILELNLIKEKREKEFIKLLAENKVVLSQKDSFMACDMQKFVENSLTLNLNATGSGIASKVMEGIDSKDRAEVKILELSKKKIVDSKAEGIEMNMSDAIAFVLSEEKELNKWYNS